MVPKLLGCSVEFFPSFRAVLFRMVPKHDRRLLIPAGRFRAVLFRMVPKQLQYVEAIL